MTKIHYEYFKQTILNSGSPYLENLNIGKLQLDKRIHLLLYFIGNNADTTEVSDRFNISAGSVIYYIDQMLQLINDIHGNHVKWPTQEEKRQIKHRFWLTSSFDNCIGAVDGTHCSIPGIIKFKQSYVARKCQYGINITAVCTPSKPISYAVVGAPGSYHDNRVWELNDIF
eukprot:NODE_209_length_12852_cov_0.583863.p4 type:complete len:171 gc:universal NODE_209_length_12852_cov_0.583863:9318-8806(-)